MVNVEALPTEEEAAEAAAAAAAASVNEIPKTEEDLISEFLKLQEQRCIAYNALESCMRQVRLNKQLCLFKHTMQEITTTFHTVSLAIMQLIKSARSQGYYTTAELLEKLQDMEQQKLKLTADTHIKLQTLAKLEPGTVSDDAEVQEQRKRRGDLIEQINVTLEDIRYQCN